MTPRRWHWLRFKVRDGRRAQDAACWCPARSLGTPINTGSSTPTELIYSSFPFPLSNMDDLKQFCRVIAGDERNTVVLKPAAH